MPEKNRVFLTMLTACSIIMPSGTIETKSQLESACSGS